ncbi:MAG: lipopolysaccharide biosynthesis protein [Bacteroidales bacterium]|nr:lipopolysaccharide biosynthesis protein [Bacteroidales bacterium]
MSDNPTMPESVHTKTKRIAKNTILLYLRSLISLFISLYTSRLVLKGLGVNDYGVYGVVGSFVSMFAIAAGSLRGAISRFLNYAMGKGDREEQINTFSLSLSIMFLLSLIVILLTETFGLWFLYNRMNIPTGRETAAFWCFQFSVLASVSSFLVVPFTSLIIAHEKMGVFAYIDVGEVVLKFLIALLIAFSCRHVDRLILYAALLLIITLSKQMISRVYAMKHFEECRIRWFWDKKQFAEMFSYAGWSFLENTSGTFAGQGVTMVINVIFGPAVNAARSLSGTVNNSIGIFVNNFVLAIWPQVTQSHASGDHDYMKQLLFRGSKFTYYIMWMIVLPLFLETEFIVGLWLGNYPDHTINFIRIALLCNLCSTLHVVLGMGIKASGNIMWRQITFSLLEFLVFVGAYILLHNGFSPEWSYFCMFISTILQILTIWVLSKKQLDVSIKEFIRSVISPSIIVSVVSCCIPVLIHLMMPYGWLRFLTVLIISLASSAICILYLGCTPPERGLITELILGKLGLVQKSPK